MSSWHLSIAVLLAGQQTEHRYPGFVLEAHCMHKWQLMLLTALLELLGSDPMLTRQLRYHYEGMTHLQLVHTKLIQLQVVHDALGRRLQYGTEQSNSSHSSLLSAGLHLPDHS